MWVKIAKLMPIEAIVRVLLEWAEREAKKTPSEIDDKMVLTVKIFLGIILKKKHRR